MSLDHTVLVVDDDPLVLEVAATACEEIGLTVVRAEDGAEAAPQETSSIGLGSFHVERRTSLHPEYTAAGPTADARWLGPSAHSLNGK
jgi:hypothetical protein